MALRPSERERLAALAGWDALDDGPFVPEEDQEQCERVMLAVDRLGLADAVLARLRELGCTPDPPSVFWEAFEVDEALGRECFLRAVLLAIGK